MGDVAGVWATAVAWSILAACTPAPQAVPAVTDKPASPSKAVDPATPPRDAGTDETLLAFEAVVRIDVEPGSKRLQAVWLERPDGERWIVAYRAEPWLVPFDGARVNVEGSRYSPGGQAVNAPHFRLDTLTVADEADATFASLGAEQTMSGRFVDDVGAPGTKLEGEHWPEFASADGKSYQLANRPEALVFETAVRITAREMQYSKFTAHRGGPMIWVLAIDGKPTG